MARRRELASGMSLKYGAERRRCPEKGDVLEANPLQSQNVPCKVINHG
jgi:hypothetical protein